MKIFVNILLLFLTPYLLGANTSDIRYARLFFENHKPSGYQYPSRNYSKEYPSSSYFQYESLDDFKTPNSWTMHYGVDMDSILNKYSGPHDSPEQYLHWKTISTKEPKFYAAIAPNVKSLPPKNASQNMLGIRAFFHIKLYHTFYITPNKPIILKNNIPKTLGLFMFGLKKKFNVFIELKDYEGLRYKVFMGNTSHEGWSVFSANLAPYHIPLVSNDTPEPQHIELTKIIFESPEPVDGFFGTWLSDLSYTFRENKSPASGYALKDQFNWKTSQSDGLTKKQGSSTTTNTPAQPK